MHGADGQKRHALCMRKGRHFFRSSRQTLGGLETMLEIFKGKGSINGIVEIVGLPKCKMYSASLSLFSVPNSSSPLPYEGKPPGNADCDTVSLKETKDPFDKPLMFDLCRRSGFFYLDVGVIAYIENGGKLIAQVEHFVPFDQPTEFVRNQDNSIAIRVNWPDIPLDELGFYGTIKPGGARHL